MAKSPLAVMPFLTALAAKLKPLREAERAVMLDLKKKEKEASGEEFDGQLNGWDFRYYVRMVKEQNYQLDDTALQEYFPLDVVTEGLLSTYQELLGLSFTQIENAEVWHEETLMYEVRNSDAPGDGREAGALVGYFYLDMFPREGKYGHAACWGLQPGCVLPDGSRQLPVSACLQLHKADR